MQVTSIPLSSKNQYRNILVMLSKKLKDKLTILRCLTSLPLWCSNVMINFPTLAHLLLSLCLAETTLTSSLLIISREWLANIALTSTQVLTWTPPSCNITLSTLISVTMLISFCTSHSISVTQMLDCSVTSYSETKSGTGSSCCSVRTKCLSMPHMYEYI